MENQLAAILVAAEQEIQNAAKQIEWLAGEVRSKRNIKKLSELRIRLRFESKKLESWMKRYGLEQYL